ncbi:hypothetical protein FOA52_015792 [Chlamydomonas sp. UWO 241]|nr:hypothetical protein FOA52_015792 [Chlamydomonas sp. UWO 241]
MQAAETSMPPPPPVSMPLKRSHDASQRAGGGGFVVRVPKTDSVEVHRMRLHQQEAKRGDDAVMKEEETEPAGRVRAVKFQGTSGNSNSDSGTTPSGKDAGGQKEVQPAEVTLTLRAELHATAATAPTAPPAPPTPTWCGGRCASRKARIAAVVALLLVVLGATAGTVAGVLTASGGGPAPTPAPATEPGAVAAATTAASGWGLAPADEDVAATGATDGSSGAAPVAGQWNVFAGEPSLTCSATGPDFIRVCGIAGWTANALAASLRSQAGYASMVDAAGYASQFEPSCAFGVRVLTTCGVEHEAAASTDGGCTRAGGFAGTPPPPRPPPPSPPPSPAPPASPAAEPGMDVWIIAGQSNAVGANYLDPTPQSVCGTPLPGQLLMFPKSHRRWMDAKASIGYFSNGFNQEVFVDKAMGPEIEFGRALLNAGVVPSGKVGFIPTATTGSYLSDWMPPSDEQPQGGTEWNTMLAVVRQAMSAAGPGAVLKGVMWVQGEADGLGADTAASYGVRFTTFVGAMRKELAEYHARLPMVMGVMSAGERLLYYPYLEPIRAAQLVNDPATSPIVRVDLGNFEFYLEVLGGQTYMRHLSKWGQCDMGAAMARQWLTSGLQ